MPDDDWDDDDDPDLDGDEDEEDDGETAVLPCPSCGAEVYEDAERCPSCGDFIARRRLRGWEGRPWWWVALGLVGIGALILWLL
ncbi:zinc-ribbon domain-containing protein [Tautonia plasticadhaerens]|uniref:Zinc-ribbon domain-containing protein n=1 Tax=Tautonia plasticadhaerens TaxID=2527974 RepID=A0A518H1R9_9BACT|nr:zinc-ribbon domain-containing protein [Tautonia plasticadhaerens]QDV34785.1 hypothetical protein ElP_26810 [Tautonia plasticadhaerens]